MSTHPPFRTHRRSPRLAERSEALHTRAQGAAPPRTTSEPSGAGLTSSRTISQALRAGARAPDFTLRDHLGWPISLARLLAQGPVVLIFYQGTWCPYSDRQLRAYERALPRMTELGAALLAISSQAPDQSLSPAEMLDLSFPVLTDPGNHVARRYGLVRDHPGAASAAHRQNGAGTLVAAGGADGACARVIPDTFVVDQAGIIRVAFADPDVTRRLEPQAALAALRQLRG
jgi:peroxiredoxin